MKKTYIIKDQGKGTVTNLPIEQIVEISGSSSSNGGGSATGDFIPLAGTEEGKNITGDLNFQKGTWGLSIRNTHVDSGNEFPDEPPVIEIYKVPYDNNQNGLRIEKGFIRSIGGGSRMTSYYISPLSLVFSGKQFENININYGFSLLPQQDGSCLVDSYTIPDGTFTKIKSKGLYGSFDYSDVEPENKLIYAQRAYVDSKINETKDYVTDNEVILGYYSDGNSYQGNRFRKILNISSTNLENGISLGSEIQRLFTVSGFAKVQKVSDGSIIFVPLNHESVQVNGDTFTYNISDSGVVIASFFSSSGNTYLEGNLEIEYAKKYTDI